ncbi:MAG: repair protein SbcD/Mre11 [Pseudonocardiales bacterium]|nr:repair protein SbcD/Mre11 [Pseudonocardiales bacterium]
MRLIHTSDWHLGRTLHGESLLEYQRGFLCWLVELARDRRADAVLVAGDVYDRAVPPTDAVALLDDALAGLAAAGVPVVVTSGNHDSAIRLGFGSALQVAAGVHLRTKVADLDRPVLLRDDAGELAVYGIPYLLPDAVMAELGAQRSHESVLATAAERIRADAAGRGISRTVAVGHAFVTGGAASDSERDIRVGGIGDAPAGVFAGITYTALGHLHGAQQVAPGVRYSGSPLPFSFSERDQAKSVAVVDIDAGGAVGVELVRTPVARPLREVRGRLDELLAGAAGESSELRDCWVKVVLTDVSRPAAPMQRLRQVWPHTLLLEFRPEGVLPTASASVERAASTTDPVEMCSDFLEWVDATRPDKKQLDVITAALDAVARQELSA